VNVWHKANQVIIRRRITKAFDIKARAAIAAFFSRQRKNDLLPW
jgi:hypothetical protein